MISEYIFKNSLRESSEYVSCTCTDGVAVHLMCLTEQTELFYVCLCKLHMSTHRCGHVRWERLMKDWHCFCCFKQLATQFMHELSLLKCVHARARGCMHIHTYVCMYVCMCVSECVRVCMGLFQYIYVYAWVSAYLHVHMCIGLSASVCIQVFV